MFVQETINVHRTRILLAKFGVMPTYLGYGQCIYAVMLCLEDPYKLQLITKTLLPEVAKHFKTSMTSVERNIRTVANIAWRNASESMCNLSGYDLTKCPTSSEFISLLVLCIKNQGVQSAEEPIAYFGVL